MPSCTPTKAFLLTTIFSLILFFQPHRIAAAPFMEGERLMYDITWLGMAVGTGTLEVQSREWDQDREVFRIVSTAQSNGLISYFFPVEDRIESTVDANGIFSYGIQIKQRHGSRRIQKQIRFDHEKRQATMIYKGKTRTYSIPPQVQDSLSSLYFLRTFPQLPVGQSIFIDVHESKKNWRVKVRILSREKVKVPMGTFDTIKVRARVEYEGVLMNKGDVHIWLTDDERRVPVMMKGDIAIGSITVSLASDRLENLSEK